MKLPDTSILVVGPIPPPAGGARLVTADFLEYLTANAIPFHHLDLPVANSRFTRIINQVSVFLKLMFAIPKSDVVILFATTPVAVFLAPVTWLACRFWRRPCLLRKFGGRFDLGYGRLWSPLKWLVRNSTLRFDLLLFETKALADHFDGISKGRVEWHSNSRRTSSSLSIKNGPPTKRFVFLGHVRPCKGIRTILAAAALVEDFQIDVYGPLRFGMREDEFESRANVNLCGVVDSNDVVATLANYDALLIPTYCETEGYPGVVFEAYIAGIPVIATDWNALPEIVEDGVSGLIVPVKDESAVAEAMKKIAEDGTLLNRLREGVVAKRETFSSEEWHGRLVEYAENLATRVS